MSNRLLPYVALLCAALLLTACGLVAEVEPIPAAPKPTEEVAAEPTPAITVAVTFNSNVRTGPDTDRDIGFGLFVGTPVTVLGRNADGTWLQIEHDGRTGWIYGELTDISTEVLAALPAEAPQTTVEAAEPVAEPTAAPEPAPAITVVVTFNSNVRTGPGTDRDIGFGLFVGTPVTVLGRNADGTWLQIEHDERTGWIYGELTDISTEVLAALPAEAAPQTTVEAAEPVAEPTAAPEPVPVDGPGTDLHEHEHGDVAAGRDTSLYTGPGNGFAILRDIALGVPLTATGIDTTGAWLLVNHDGQPGWIHTAHTDISDGMRANLTVVTDWEAIAAPPAPEPKAAARAPAMRRTAWPTPATGCL